MTDVYRINRDDLISLTVNRGNAGLYAFNVGLPANEASLLCNGPSGEATLDATTAVNLSAPTISLDTAANTSIDCTLTDVALVANDGAITLTSGTFVLTVGSTAASLVGTNAGTLTLSNSGFPLNITNSNDTINVTGSSLVATASSGDLTLESTTGDLLFTVTSQALSQASTGVAQTFECDVKRVDSVVQLSNFRSTTALASGAAIITLTNYLPADYRPSTTPQRFLLPVQVNSVRETGYGEVATDGTITVQPMQGTFSASGNNGVEPNYGHFITFRIA